MSRKAVVEFLAQVRGNAALGEVLANAPSAETYVELGKRAGCDFTVDELRSVTSAERFYLEAQKNAALSGRLAQTTSDTDIVALVREQGFDCRLEDLQAVVLPYTTVAGDQLSDAQLEAVAGGTTGGRSFPDTGKAPAPPFGSVPIPYPRW